MHGFSNPHIEKFLENIGSDEGRAWFKGAVKAIRTVFPEIDFWVLGGAEKKIRVCAGKKTREASKGNRVFVFRQKTGDKPFHIQIVKQISEKFRKDSIYKDDFLSSSDIADYLAKNIALFNDVKSNLAGESLNPDDYSSIEIGPDSISKLPLNQILFGPPGTGKTYTSIYATLKILDPELAEEYREVDEDAKCTMFQRQEVRMQLKQRFDEFVADQRVRFVTFHQSFSYEDFVEGLRAETDDVNGQIRYEVVDGVFKSLCSEAKSGSDVSDSFARAVERLEEKLQAANNKLRLKTLRGYEFDIKFDGGKTVHIFPLNSVKTDSYYTIKMENVKKLYSGEPKSKMSNPSYVDGVLRYLVAECGLPAKPEFTQQVIKEPYVLIIDEINRGNISRIFGELITLIEPSKRAGSDEALAVTLPYSKETFSVPDNVYLIGTMNTADRSLAGLDLALRRRFSFTEMPPKPDLLDKLVVNQVNIGQMLRVMNQRITALLDRDHCIGHAYFMSLTQDSGLADLREIFEQKIIPLLQEYFFEDWERIRWVLNDQNKGDDAFIVEDTAISISNLFPNVQDKIRTNPRWIINAKAFSNANSYRYIAGATGSDAN